MSYYFSKNITFMKFFQKMCETKSQQFSHCDVCRLSVLLRKFSTNSIICRKAKIFRETAFFRFVLLVIHFMIFFRTLTFHKVRWNSMKYNFVRNSLVSRKLCKKWSLITSTLPHCTVWKSRKFTLTHFWQKNSWK